MLTLLPLTAESIERDGRAESELIVRRVEVEASDVADLAETIEDRVTMHVELGGCDLDVLSDIEEQAQRTDELGLMFLVIRA